MDLFAPAHLFILALFGALAYLVFAPITREFRRNPPRQSQPSGALCCPHCSRPYFASDYSADPLQRRRGVLFQDSETIYCSACEAKLPRWRPHETRDDDRVASDDVASTLTVVDLDPVAQAYGRMLASNRILRAMAYAVFGGLVALPPLILVIAASEHPEARLIPISNLLVGMATLGFVVAIALAVFALPLAYCADRIAAGSVRAAAASLVVFAILIVLYIADAFLEFDSRTPGGTLLRLGGIAVGCHFAFVATLGSVEIIRSRRKPWFAWCLPIGNESDQRPGLAALISRTFGSADQPVGSSAWVLVGFALLAEGFGYWCYLSAGASLESRADQSQNASLITAAFWVIYQVALGFAFMKLGLALGRGFRNKARRLRLQPAESVTANDQRRPVLFLRSFRDDQVSLEGARPPLYIRLVDPGERAGTLEELIVRNWAGIAPVIAVGRPGELLQPIGATRYYVGGEGWQETVTALAKDSASIVLGLCDTEGVSWEIALVTRKYLHKAILVMPPQLGAERVVLQRLGHRLNTDLLGLADRAQTEGRYVLALLSDAQGKLLILASKSVTELDYEVALRAAHILQEPDDPPSPHQPGSIQLAQAPALTATDRRFRGRGWLAMIIYLALGSLLLYGARFVAHEASVIMGRRGTNRPILLQASSPAGITDDLKSSAQQFSDQAFALLESVKASPDTERENPATGPIATFASDSWSFSEALRKGDMPAARRAMVALEVDRGKVDTAARQGAWLPAERWAALKEALEDVRRGVPTNNSR
jgi:hypothetical protein